MCLGLLAYMLARLGLWWIASPPVPSDLDSRSSLARAHAREGWQGGEAFGGQRLYDSVVIRDGWQTTPSEQEPGPRALLLLDLYVYLRRSWDDGHEARQTTRGLIGGGTGEQPRPKRLVKAARRWVTETGVQGSAADRLLGQLIDAEVVVQDAEGAHSSADTGWRLLRPAEASPQFERMLGVGLQRAGPRD